MTTTSDINAERALQKYLAHKNKANIPKYSPPHTKINHSTKTIFLCYEHLIKKKKKLLLENYYDATSVVYRYIHSKVIKSVNIFIKNGYKIVFQHKEKVVLLYFNR
jgi:hypothetical protein